MRRREFIETVIGAGFLPIAARAQQPAKMKRIALVTVAKAVNNDPNRVAFDEELKHLGYFEGKNLIIDLYSAEGQANRSDDLVREVVSSNPDLVLSIGALLTRSFKAATSTIPIVAMTGDPIRFGIVSNISRPGGNITGVSTDAGVEIWGKRLEILAEAVPKLVNVVYISTGKNLNSAGDRATQAAAQKLGISLVHAPLGSTVTEAEYHRVFDSIQRDQVDGIIFSAEFEHYPFRVLLVQLVQQLLLPAMYDTSDYVDAGGLISYSLDVKGAMRQLAAQAAMVLNGASPSDIPYVQVVHFALVINLKTAKSLGLELPATLLARADRVIE